MYPKYDPTDPLQRPGDYPPEGYMHITDAVAMTELPQKEFFKRYIATRILKTYGPTPEVGYYVKIEDVRNLPPVYDGYFYKAGSPELVPDDWEEEDGE